LPAQLGQPKLGDQLVEVGLEPVLVTRGGRRPHGCGGQDGGDRAGDGLGAVGKVNRLNLPRPGQLGSSWVVVGFLQGRGQLIGGAAATGDHQHRTAGGDAPLGIVDGDLATVDHHRH
jgi:hypothetical protein